MTAPSVKLDAKKLSAQVANLRDIAKQDKWVANYDSDVDQFFFMPKSIPNDTFLVTFDDEISLYLNKESEVKGLFIEYFSHNFVEHDKEIKPAVDIWIENSKSNATNNKLAKEVVIKEVELKAIEAFFKDLGARLDFSVAI